MYASESRGDFGNLESGEQSGVYTRFRDQSRTGMKVLPLEHPTDDEFPPSEISTDRQWIKELFDLGEWKKGGWSRLLERIFPIVVWIRSYKWGEYLKADLIAGVTVGTMTVPQAMSYSTLAGLPPIYGLYGAFVPVLTYAVFGSSRQLGVGPVAMVSLVVSNCLGSLVKPDEIQTEEGQKLYIDLAIQLALMVGIIECFMGLVRMGWLIRFISHSVVSGFTTASAVIIALSQAKSFCGYEISRSSKLIAIATSIIDGSDGFLWQPFLMGSVTLALLLIMKHLGKTYSHLRYLRAGGPISAIILGIIFVKIFRPASISLVGIVPRGFPTFSIHFNFKYAKQLLPHAALVTGVGILESVGIAAALAAKNGYEIDSNQELFGLGISNLCGSAFSASPVAGSFSRSAVNNESGAKTGLSGVVVFLILSATLLFLTPFFTDVPDCCLAAIVVSAVIGLFDYQEAMFLWRVEKRDLVLWTAACLFTLFYGIEIGVLTGVALSLACVIYESANPHTAILGRLPGTTVYRSLQQYPKAYTYHGMVIIRVDAPMYFANISFIKEKLRSCETFVGISSRRGVEVDRIYYVIVDMSPVTYIDSSAVHAIIELYQNYKARGMQLALCNPSHKVLTTLRRSGVLDSIGHEWYFVRVHDAVQTCISKTQAKHEGADKDDIEGVTVSINEVPDAEVSRRGQPWQSGAPETVPFLSDTT